MRKKIRSDGFEERWVDSETGLRRQIVYFMRTKINPKGLHDQAEVWTDHDGYGRPCIYLKLPQHFPSGQISKIVTYYREHAGQDQSPSETIRRRENAQKTLDNGQLTLHPTPINIGQQLRQRFDFEKENLGKHTPFKIQGTLPLSKEKKSLEDTKRSIKKRPSYRHGAPRDLKNWASAVWKADMGSDFDARASALFAQFQNLKQRNNWPDYSQTHLAKIAQSRRPRRS